MKNITVGILAHVDAGKTTLSEALLYTSGQNILQIGDYAFWGQGKIGGILPVPVIFMIVATIVIAYIMNQTRLGRSFYAIGGNEEAANASGINVVRSKYMAFLINGILVGIAGVLFMARVNAGLPNGAVGYEMEGLTAAIVGGTSFSGGIGTTSGTLIGSFIIGCLNNIMNLQGVDSYIQQVVKGIIIVGAVLYDVRFKNKKAPKVILKKNTWGYMTFVFEGATCHVYENGVSVGDVAIDKCVDNNSPLVFGGASNAANGAENEVAWNGWIDEVFSMTYSGDNTYVSQNAAGYKEICKGNCFYSAGLAAFMDTSKLNFAYQLTEVSSAGADGIAVFALSNISPDTYQYQIINGAFRKPSAQLYRMGDTVKAQLDYIKAMLEQSDVLFDSLSETGKQSVLDAMESLYSNATVPEDALDKMAYCTQTKTSLSGLKLTVKNAFSDPDEAKAVNDELDILIYWLELTNTRLNAKN